MGRGCGAFPSGAISEDTAKVPHHAYKPFGNGERACIGMQFALYEATLVLGMVLKHFELIDYSNYESDVKQTLTLKPGDFRIQVKAREGVTKDDQALPYPWKRNLLLLFIKI